MVFEGIEAIEDAIVEILFPKIVPEVFLRIQFGEVRREEQQAKIVREMEVLGFVPAGAIEDHDDIVVRVATGNLVEEDLHALGIDVRQYPAVESAL